MTSPVPARHVPANAAVPNDAPVAFQAAASAAVPPRLAGAAHAHQAAASSGAIIKELSQLSDDAIAASAILKGMRQVLGRMYANVPDAEVLAVFARLYIPDTQINALSMNLYGLGKSKSSQVQTIANGLVYLDGRRASAHIFARRAAAVVHQDPAGLAYLNALNDAATAYKEHLGACETALTDPHTFAEQWRQRLIADLDEKIGSRTLDPSALPAEGRAHYARVRQILDHIGG